MKLKTEDYRRRSVTAALLMPIAMAALIWAGDAHAAGPSTRRRTATTAPAAAPAPSAAEANARLEALSGQVDNLRSGQTAATNEIKQIQQAITVAPPPEANAAPKTVGEHVAVLEGQLSDVRKNIADNLGVHIHGLVDAGYEYNANDPNTTGGGKGGPNTSTAGAVPGRTNQLRVFDQDANSFQLDQFNLHIDRTVEGGVGFVVDLNFGKVAEVLRASTRYSNSNPGGTSNDIVDPTQAYLTYTVPVGKGINLSAGKYVTLLGEETINTYNNLNYNESKSFIFGFGIPFTHTGIRSQYSFTDRIGLTLGVNNGWDDVSDNNTGKSLEGQLALTPTDAISLLINGMYGPEQVNHGNSKRGIIDPILSWKTPLTGLTLIGEYLYAHEDAPVSTTPAFSSQGNSLTTLPAGPFGTVAIPHGVDWMAAAGYAVYDLNDKIEFAARGEMFRDSDGARTGLRQTLGEFTGTLNYKVTSGLLARLEYRHDESNAKPFFDNSSNPANAGLPFHTLAGQDTLGAYAIYAF